VLNCLENRWEIHPRFYRHLAWGRHTSTQLHEVYRQHSHNPQVCSTILTLYTRHKDMLTRYAVFLQETQHSLTRRSAAVPRPVQ